MEKVMRADEIRCEVCGAPLEGDTTRCKMCVSRSSSAPGMRSQRPTVVPEEDREPTMNLRSSSSPPPKIEEGQSKTGSIILENKYRLVNEIGRGAMGTVFLAEDIALQREVAVKFLLPELIDVAECAHRFKYEAIGMAAIRDNNVAQIYTYGEHGNTPYFIMEYLDGETVENMIDAHNRRGFFIPMDEVIDILVQSLGGLGAIHRAGAVHRDIKSANIMLTGNPARSVIMDFGLVRMVRIEDNMRALAGTPAYIAPELIEGYAGAEKSPQTDIYSMGVTAFELLTGTLPFGGETWVEILRKHITEIPPFPSEKRSGLPTELDDIILRALSKDPKERYQTCDEFIDDLLEVQQLTNIEHRMSSPAVAASRRSRSSSRPSMGRMTPVRGVRKTPSSGRGRLLVADADPDFRALVHQTAKSSVPGCRVNSATDGHMALSQIEEFRPHVMVLDLSLPEINGLEIVATVRGDSNHNEMMIVVVAKNGGKFEAELLGDMGVAHFLTKPVDPDHLAEILRPMLEHAFSLSRISSTSIG